MKLRTIWTLRGLPLRERLQRTPDALALAAVRFIPARVRYWTAMRGIAAATTDSPDIPATPLDAILKNLPGGPR